MTWTLAGRQLQEEGDVDPFEDHGVDGEEVAGGLELRASYLSTEHRDLVA
jgi:hypothetical protein